MKTGNGDVASLCNFGERDTPNEHKIVRDFALLDNTYCCGMISADGHQWTDTGIATDYIEREFAGFPRSYPSGGFGERNRDALASRPRALFGTMPLRMAAPCVTMASTFSTTVAWKDPGEKGRRPGFLDCFLDFVTGVHAIAFTCQPDMESLRPFMVTNMPKLGLGHTGCLSRRAVHQGS